MPRTEPIRPARKGSWRRRWPLVLLALIALGSAATWYYFNYRDAAEAPAEPALQTARVRVGDITITANGSGNLLPAQELAVGFRSAGVVAEIAVQVGDRVEAGDLLARQDDADAQAQVAQAEVNLRLAELKLAGLSEEADAVALASAKASLASAEADLSKLLAPATEAEVLAAQENLRSARGSLALLSAGPDPDKVAIAKANVTLAEINLRAAQAAYDRIAGRDNAGATREAAELWQATTNYEKAQAEYREAQAGPTSDDLAAARAKVALSQAQSDALLADPDPMAEAAARARVTQAEAQLAALSAGPAAHDLETAELGVTLAGYSLENARRGLAEKELRAPMAGTVVAVQAQAGEAVGTAAIITLADLEAPLVRFWVEETDLLSVAPGNPVEIVFEAMPDLIFSGQIVRVDPALVTVDGTPAIQAWASVDLSAHSVALLSGMTAEVEIIAGQTEGALLVPAQALRELSPGQYAVFVVGPDGSLELRTVEVGLRDFANAEILSGLERGDTISTGTVATE